MQQLGKYLLVAGLLLALTGAIFWLAGDRIKWPPRLPGDIFIKKKNFSFYFPVTSMILLSLLLSALLWLLRRMK
jgi:hypothetical protein